MLGFAWLLRDKPSEMQWYHEPMQVRKRWAGLSPKKRRRILFLLSTLFGVSFLLGWYIGRAYSPEYDSEFAAAKYISATFHVQNGRTSNPILIVQAGPRTYTYIYSQDSVHFDFPPPEILAAMPLPHRNIIEENDRLVSLSGVFAAPASAIGVGDQLYKVTETITAPERTALLVVAAATSLTGGALGAYVGYHDDRNWESANFLKGMGNKDNWKPVAQRIAICEQNKQMLAALDLVLSGPHDPAPDSVKLQTQAMEKIEEVRKNNDRCQQFLAWAYRQN
jgi:hypothetical protein